MQIYHYKGHFGFESKCGLKFIPHQGEPSQIYVVLTELNQNPGTSITNAYEKIATAIYSEFLIQTPIEKINWIEHYTNESYAAEKDTWETFDSVTLHWNESSKQFENADWKRCDASTASYLKQKIRGLPC